jgi:hypothetical protein
VDRPHVALLPPLGVIVVEEAVGILGAVWCYRRFGLRDRARREQLLRTGRARVVSS